jgi:hypothetical protein
MAAARTTSSTILRFDAHDLAEDRQGVVRAVRARCCALAGDRGV